MLVKFVKWFVIVVIMLIKLILLSFWFLFGLFYWSLLLCLVVGSYGLIEVVFLILLFKLYNVG